MARVMKPDLHTSSCSMAQVVLSTLTALDVANGNRVLEIGTGIAEQARTNLAKLNRPITVVTGDGG
ncbi:MAG: hypothetical protein M3Y48_14970 [Actinomycetota bacterium]|nr:hypothetical protein [Actinomycetota bacterium]